MDTPQAPVAAPAPPAAPATVKDIARGFLQEIDENPDPNQFDDHSAPDEGEPAEGESQEEPVEQEAETPPPSTDPVIEYELDDGEKVQVSEKLKPHLMRDKDYRQKTMAIAEQRKALEQLTQAAQQVATQAQQLAPFQAQLVALDNNLQQMHNALQSGALDNDPLEFNKVQGQLALGLRNRDYLAQQIGEQSKFITQQQEQLRANKLALDAPKLFEEVPDLAKQEVRADLAKYVRDSGLSQAEIDHLNYSTAGAKLAWKAKQYDAMVKEQASTKAKLKEQVKTLPSVSQSSRAQQGANTKTLLEAFKKTGGDRNSPEFRAYMRAKLR